MIEKHENAPPQRDNRKKVFAAGGRCILKKQQAYRRNK